MRLSTSPRPWGEAVVQCGSKIKLSTIRKDYPSTRKACAQVSQNHILPSLWHAHTAGASLAALAGSIFGVPFDRLDLTDWQESLSIARHALPT